MRAPTSVPLRAFVANLFPHFPLLEAVLQVSTSARSLSGLNRRSATTSVILSSDNSVLTTTPAVAISEEVKHVSSSPDGNRQALFRVVPAKEGKEQRRIVEVVDVKSGRKESEVEVTKEHGDWYLEGACSIPLPLLFTFSTSIFH